nr:hypothetical protein [Edaphobacter dinghuensis]
MARLLSFETGTPFSIKGIRPSGGMPLSRMLQPIQPALLAVADKGFLWLITSRVINERWIATRSVIIDDSEYRKSKKLDTLPLSMRRIIEIYAPSTIFIPKGLSELLSS